MADNEEVQLLHESGKIEQATSTSSNRSLIYAGVFLVLVVLVYGALFMYEQSINDSNAVAMQSIQNITDSRDIEVEGKIIEFDTQLRGAAALLAGHVLWSQVFDQLNTLIDPRVRIGSLDTEFKDKKFTLTAVADSYTTIARQIATFYASDAIEEVSVGTISVGQDGLLSFSSIIKFNGEEFKRKVTDQ